MVVPSYPAERRSAMRVWDARHAANAALVGISSRARRCSGRMTQQPGQVGRSADETHLPVRGPGPPDHLAVICDRKRAPHQEALHLVASFLCEIRELFPG